MLADENGVPVSRMFAGAAEMDDITFARTSDVLFQVCTGQCQSWGALDRLEHLMTLRGHRIQSNYVVFDIEARTCLDRCAHAPAMIVHTPDGVAALDRVEDIDLDEAVEQLCS